MINKNEHAQDGYVSSKLNAWLSIAQIQDASKKFSSDNVTWRLKAVSFCGQSNQVLFSPLPIDEQDLLLESPLKSPGFDFSSKSITEITGGSKSVYQLSRQRLEQNSGSFKQFISRKWSRSKNPGGKLTPSKSLDAASPKSPSNLPVFGSCKSQDSDISIDEDSAECIISLSDPERAIIRPVHSSIFNREYCFQLLTPYEAKYICCSCEDEYNMWLASLSFILQKKQDTLVRLNTSLSIWIIEAKGVQARKQYFCEVLLDKVLFSRTSVKYKSDILFWGEQFLFEDLPPTESVTVTLFRESETKKKRKQEKSLFVGSCVINLLDIDTNTEIEKWLSVYVPGMSPKLQQKVSVSGNRNDQPMVRTKLKYETTVVLPLSSYDELNTYLSLNYLKLSNILEGVISLKVKDLLAQTLLKIMHCNEQAEVFLVDLIMSEVQNTTNENLTFRANSLATKSIDTYMKMIGRNYLLESLGSFIASVYESEIDAEVDPQKIGAGNSLADNQKNLLKLVDDAWKAIFLSVNIFPSKLQHVFTMVRKRCEAIDRTLIVERIVSASLFLRFLCPAILTPNLFYLYPEYPNERVSRCLTLVAKTLQNLANFTRFGTKENYMKVLNDFVEIEIPNMKNFLQSISYEPLESSTVERSKKPFCVAGIDLARELSVVYHLLKEELTKISDSREKHDLAQLSHILFELEKLYEISPKADELRLSKRFETMADVCNKPLMSPASHSQESATSPTSTLTPTSSVMTDDVDNISQASSYRDISLSVTEDYVSGCVPDSFTRSQSSKQTSLDTGRKGQAPPSPMRSRSAGDALDVKSTSEAKKKFDKIMNQSVFTKTSVKQIQSEPVLTSIKKRGSVKQVPAKVCRKETVKDRISMFSQNSSSTSSSPVIRDHAKRPSPDLSTSPTRSRASPLRSNTLGSTAQRPSLNKSPPPAPPPKPVSRSGSLTNSTHSIASDRSWVRDKYVERKTPENNRRPSMERSKFNREQLKLDTLRREHRFNENKTSNKDSNKSKVNSKSTLEKSPSNKFSYSKTLEKSPSNKPAPPVRRNTISNDVISSPNKPQQSFETPLLENQVTETFMSRTYSPRDVYPNAPIRRHSELTYKELERKSHSTHHDTEMVYEQPRVTSHLERNDSFLSSCSSDCSYSSECYSTDDSYGIFIEGDNLSDVMKGRESDDLREQNNYVARHNEINSMQSITPSNSAEETLRHMLLNTEYELKKTRQELSAKTIHFQNTVIHLKEKLVEADRKMKVQRSETETQMKGVIGRLLNVESELRREHNEMQTILNGKEKIISIQAKRIATLEAANNRLVGALSKIRQKYAPDDVHDALNIEENGNEANDVISFGENGNGLHGNYEEERVDHV